MKIEREPHSVTTPNSWHKIASEKDKFPRVNFDATELPLNSLTILCCQTKNRKIAFAYSPSICHSASVIYGVDCYTVIYSCNTSIRRYYIHWSQLQCVDFTRFVHASIYSAAAAAAAALCQCEAAVTETDTWTLAHLKKIIVQYKTYKTADLTMYKKKLNYIKTDDLCLRWVLVIESIRRGAVRQTAPCFYLL